MSFQLEWEVEGEKQLSRVLTNLQADTKNLLKPFKAVTDRLRKEFESDVFKTRGAVIEENWPRLSPVTVARKARAGYANPTQPLVATGRMQRSFRSLASTSQGVIWNDAEYFKYHQSNKPRKKIPRRVMMKLATDQKDMIVQEFHKHIYNSMKRR